MHAWSTIRRGAIAIVTAITAFAPVAALGDDSVANGAVADPPAPADFAAPAAPLAVWIAAAGLGADEVGAVALPLDGSPALISHEAQRALNPASTIKLLTTWAALALLGPDYRWRTAFHLRGRLEAGVLHGDLVLRGGGDPKLVIEHLVAIVAQMRAGGLERIAGDLVIDDSIYEPPTANEGDFDGEPSQPYNVGPFGALMNFKSVRITVRPLDDIVELSFDPDLSGVGIESQVQLVGGPCRHPAGSLLVRDAGTREVPVVRVSGRYSRACGEQSSFSAVLDHRQYVDALFRAAWQAGGGRWSGRTRIERGAARGEPWLVWQSPHTLADVVRDVDKFSNNVMARHLMLQLAVDAGARPATQQAGRDRLRSWLRSQGLEFPGLVIDNGSGLSRSGRTSALQLAQVLRRVAAGPQASALRQSLPIAGIDGTMRSRFVGEAIAGRAWIKTGSLEDTRALAGYVAAASGRRYAVALIVNGPRAAASRPLQDAFLRWVHDHG